MLGVGVGVGKVIGEIRNPGLGNPTARLNAQRLHDALQSCELVEEPHVALTSTERCHAGPVSQHPLRCGCSPKLGLAYMTQPVGQRPDIDSDPS